MKNLVKVNKVKKFSAKENVIVPNLLLSQTYFLNDEHTCYLSIGFDTESFKPAIVLLKNTVFHQMCVETWTTAVYNNWETIKNHFMGQTNILELPKTTSDCSVKLTSRGGQQRIVFTHGCKKIILNSEEWSRAEELLSFLQTVINWSETVWQQIADYHHIYMMKCCGQNSYALAAVDFFIPPVTGYNFFNYARLFNEIPILCRQQLINNYYLEVCKQNYEINA